eukprot:1142346-Pelagomonas_calceolata.AAC.1
MPVTTFGKHPIIHTHRNKTHWFYESCLHDDDLEKYLKQTSNQKSLDTESHSTPVTLPKTGKTQSFWRTWNDPRAMASSMGGC